MEIGSRKRKSLGAATETVSPAVAEHGREIVRQRFQAELAAVRRLVKKAAAVPVPRPEEPPAKRSKKATPPPPPPHVMKVSPPPHVMNRKKMKASPPDRVIKSKKVTRDERDLLKADVEKLASELPDHIRQFLLKHCRAIHGDEMEIDIHAVQDEAVLELRKQVDEFVREMGDQQRQDGKMMMMAEEDVDIVGGVSPLAPIVSAPLNLAEEEDEYVDICGDASPVANLGGGAISGGSPSSSSSSDSDSDSDSASDSSDSRSDSDESVDSPAPAERAATPPRTELITRAKESLERQRKEARCRAREKARQDVLEAERTAMPTETIHWTVIKSLGIHEYGLGPHSLLGLLGLSLKIEDDQEQQPSHRQSFQQEELEEGEILG